MTLVARFYVRLGDHAVDIARRVVYLWNELYQIETFLTPKTVVPGAESACWRIAGSGRGKLVTTSCSGSAMAFLVRVTGVTRGLRLVAAGSGKIWRELMVNKS